MKNPKYFDVTLFVMPSPVLGAKVRWPTMVTCCLILPVCCWKQVETRWRTMAMVKQFKKTVDHNNKTGRDRKEN